MKSITIDSYTDWTSLPWTQIQEKIFIIQQHIYNYSKECNQKKVHELQNYILNSSDSKIFAIQTITDSIAKYYITYSQENYNFNDKHKFLIYESLFKKNISYKESFFISEQIKQYLVYLCLKPEWEARFEPADRLTLNNSKQYYSLYRLSRFILKNKTGKLKSIKKYCFTSKITAKCIDIKYLVSKIQPVTSILHYLQNWLSNRYIIENLNNKIYLNNTIDNLHQLLYRIMYCGFGWYNTTLFNHNSFHIFADSNYNVRIYSANFLNKLAVKNIINLVNYSIGIRYHHSYICNERFSQTLYLFSNYLTNYYKKNKSSIYISPFVYRYFKIQVKQILYHRNFLQKWRSNNHLQLKYILKKIKNKIINFYLYYYPLINKLNVNNLMISLEDIIFRWTKKNKSKIHALTIYKKTKYFYLSQHKEYKYYYS